MFEDLSEDLRTRLTRCKTLGGPADLRTLLILAGPPTAQKLFVSSEDPINFFLILAGPPTAQKLFVSSEDLINLFPILAGPPTAQNLFVSSEDPMNLFQLSLNYGKVLLPITFGLD